MRRSSCSSRSASACPWPAASSDARRRWPGARSGRWRRSPPSHATPPRFRRLGTPSRLDQVVDWLRTRSRVPVVDLRDDLRQAKAHERVYHRTGSHWNERGAFVAYQRVIEALRQWFPALSALPREAFEDAVEEGAA